MLIFTTLAKIYSTKYFCNRKVARLGEFFFRENFQLYSIITLRITTLPFLLGGGDNPDQSTPRRQFAWKIGNDIHTVACGSP